jgi:hypothetical protein
MHANGNNSATWISFQRIAFSRAARPNLIWSLFPYAHKKLSEEDFAGGGDETSPPPAHKSRRYPLITTTGLSRATSFARPALCTTLTTCCASLDTPTPVPTKSGE